MTTSAAGARRRSIRFPDRINVARASNGGVATALVHLRTPNYPASGAINGDRKGLHWGAGGGWNDGTQNASPGLDRGGLRGPQADRRSERLLDAGQLHGAGRSDADDDVHATGACAASKCSTGTASAWVAVPGGVVTNNNLVWRKVVFVPITTTKIRVFITAALNGYSRVMEVEAWGVSAGRQRAAGRRRLTSPVAGRDVHVAGDASRSTRRPATVTAACSRSQFFANGAPIGTDTIEPVQRRRGRDVAPAATRSRRSPPTTRARRRRRRPCT